MRSKNEERLLRLLDLKRVRLANEARRSAADLDAKRVVFLRRKSDIQGAHDKKKRTKRRVRELDHRLVSRQVEDQDRELRIEIEIDDDISSWDESESHSHHFAAPESTRSFHHHAYVSDNALDTPRGSVSSQSSANFVGGNPTAPKNETVLLGTMRIEGQGASLYQRSLLTIQEES